MSSRSLGDALLRPSSLTLSRLSTTPQTCPTTARLLSLQWSSLSSRRNISSGAGAPTQPNPTKQPSSSRPVSQPRQQQQEPNNANPFQDLVEAQNKWSIRGRPQQSSTSTTIDNLLRRNNDSRYRRINPNPQGDAPGPATSTANAAQRIFGADFSNRGPRRPGRRTALDVSSLASGPIENPPEGVLRPDGSFETSPYLPKTPVIPESEKIYPRLDPSYGRTIELDPSRNRDLVRGISMLGALVTRNRIRSDMTAQKYHERPGLKRKRLASQRWRNKFKQGFQTVTARVMELTRKGW
ncbi:unnamed protein product [Periconia digitata]|uniref:Ribosomal protein S21 n=1 Tax=Periconia digitata TaxID=1303443 RepID=A0A9W4UJC3_9PLEO|nr:unnamed protein product [Periconia digitata]